MAHLLISGGVMIRRALLCLLTGWLAALASGGSALAAGGTFVYVTGQDIQIFRLDRKTGGLTAVDRLPIPASYMAWDRTQRRTYALSGASGVPTITAFACDTATGRLTKINEAPLPGVASGTHIWVHPSGRWLLTAHFGSDQAAVVAVRPDGGAGERVDLQKPGARAHQILSDPTGRFVLVPCRDANYVAQYRIDEATGKLSPNDPPSAPAIAPGAGPRHMDFHPNGRFAYVINEKGGTLTSYRYDKAKGTLSDPEDSATMPPDRPANSTTAHVVVHPNGRFVYGSNRGHDSIAIFAIDGATGRLRRIGIENGGGVIATPRDFGIDPAGRFLFVGNQKAPGSVTVFAIDPRTGLLALRGTHPTGNGPSFVGVVGRR
jgi:6-phosphogluconolactonase